MNLCRQGPRPALVPGAGCHRAGKPTSLGALATRRHLDALLNRHHAPLPLPGLPLLQHHTAPTLPAMAPTSADSSLARVSASASSAAAPRASRPVTTAASWPSRRLAATSTPAGDRSAGSAGSDTSVGVAPNPPDVDDDAVAGPLAPTPPDSVPQPERAPSAKAAPTPPGAGGALMIRDAGMGLAAADAAALLLRAALAPGLMPDAGREAAPGGSGGRPPAAAAPAAPSSAPSRALPLPVPPSMLMGNNSSGADSRSSWCALRMKRSKSFARAAISMASCADTICCCCCCCGDGGTPACSKASSPAEPEPAVAAHAASGLEEVGPP